MLINDNSREKYIRENLASRILIFPKYSCKNIFSRFSTNVIWEIDLPSFQKPVTGDFSDGKSALDLARKLARKLNARALVNHNIAVSKRDPNVSTGEKKKNQ